MPVKRLHPLPSVAGSHSGDQFVTTARRFGGYLPERSIRPLQPCGIHDQASLRQLRAMLKLQDPETALSLVEFHVGVTFFEALQLAEREQRLLVPNTVHDGFVNSSPAPISILGYQKIPYPAWTGTVIIYVEPDKEFGDKVIFVSKEYIQSATGWVRKDDVSVDFDVPIQFRNLVNCALAVEHPDFKLVDKGNGKYQLLVDNTGLHLIENFPKSTKRRCLPDGQFGIPSIEPNNQTAKDSFRELRRSPIPYIGPIVRAFGDGFSGGDDYKAPASDDVFVNYYLSGSNKLSVCLAG